MSLKLEIAAWDMKSRAVIFGIYNRYASDSEFIDLVIELFDQTDLQRGATWLLKQYVDQGKLLTPDQLVLVYCHVDQFDHWESKLHILQCGSHLQIPEPCLSGVEKFLRDGMKSEQKFVRAWAYYGFYELAAQYSSFQAEAKSLLQKALEVEKAGSVRARISKALKKGF